MNDLELAERLVNIINLYIVGLKGLLLWISVWLLRALDTAGESDPVPKPWPLQFHAHMYQNRTGKLSTIDLWYDYPNGRNLNLIQKQLGVLTYDVEYTNGTSFYYELEQGTCKKVTFSVGILRPDWLSGATYIGTENIDGFKCNVWEKANFIRYWEDVESQRPVSWLFLSSQMWIHIMTFEEGNVLEDKNWQAPPSCFEKSTASYNPRPESKANKHVDLAPFSRASLGVHPDLFRNKICFQ